MTSKFKGTEIQSLIQLGIEKHGTSFKNYLENFPKFDYSNITQDLNFNVNVEDFQYYEDTFGNLELRNKLSERESRKYGFDLEKNNVILTNGVTHGLYLCLLVLKIRGFSHVCIPSPSYSGYKDICELLDLKFSPYDLSQGFNSKVFDSLRKKNGKSVLIINSPHNPTGSCLSEEDLRNIDKCILQNHYTVVFDAIYDDLIFESSKLDWNKWISKSSFENCFWVNSFSKNFGLPGLRLGWVLSDKTNISQIEPILERNLICLNSVSQRIALKILSLNNESFKKELLKRRDYLIKRLGNINGIEFDVPIAGTTIMITSRDFEVNLLIKQLINRGIGILPGNAYYGGTDNTFRLSFGYNYSEIDDFVEEIRDVLTCS